MRRLQSGVIGDSSVQRTLFCFLALALAVSVLLVPRIAGQVPHQGDDWPTETTPVGQVLQALSRRFSAGSRSPSAARLHTLLREKLLSPEQLLKNRVLQPCGDSWCVSVLRRESADGRFVEDVDRSGAMPLRVGEMRRDVRLSPAGKHYNWDVSETIQMGRVSRHRLDLSVAALRSGIERACQGGADLIPDARAATAGVMDVALSCQARDGEWLLRLHAGLKKASPDATGRSHVWGYFRQHFGTLDMVVDVRDSSGATWFRFRANRGVFVLEFGLAAGRLAPIAGRHATSAPLSFAVTYSASTRVGPFRIGMHEGRGRLNLSGSPVSAGLEFVFDSVPDWRLPFFAGSLLSRPLEVPFSGTGLRVSASVEEAADGTRLRRQWQATVRPHWVTSLVGGVASRARGDAGVEVADFVAGALAAFRRDFERLEQAPPARFSPLLAGGATARSPRPHASAFTF